MTTEYKFFLDLVRANEPKTKVDEKLKQIIARSTWDDTCDPDRDCILSIATGSKMIAENSFYSVCYHDRDCMAESKRIYKYKNHYILSYYEGGGDDMEVFKFFEFLAFNGDLEIKAKLNIEDAIKFLKPKKLETLIKLFTHFCKDKPLQKLQDYVKKEFNVQPGTK